MSTKFFQTNSYFIDEKVNFLKFENEYKVFDESGASTGAVLQKISFGQKLLRLLVNKAMLPFKLDFVNVDNVVEASLSRGWTFFMSKLTVTDGTGTSIATIKQKFKFFKPTFRIFDSTETQIAEITGDWKAWNFSIKDMNGNEIGAISKKWGGLAKEVFTSADKYNVSITVPLKNEDHKKAILSCAIAIDMILKETK
ncbi:phospholipid scramblase-related protein [Cytophagaceae bacterium DM2B3-1]|uniref:Phospholipid scramblase-related protein n=1 Tax=Xanthocytophaga flava TaxID=3048013 RepID=A0ABT7CML6_9BACT|nr:phospholipid scramblase-related protein [Xanthocytophaga flavus]MDJ1469313.1 phospholipid scramblase-related protein [Xanthocytophaga flavus]MDJ1494227.1 phospholipid scramblase-related protein [Xanthocytophaga flavus]